MWNWAIPGQSIEMFVWDSDCEQDLPSLDGANSTSGEPAFYTIEKISDHAPGRTGKALMTQHNGGNGSARFHLGVLWSNNGVPRGNYRVSVDCYAIALGSDKCYLRVIADTSTYVANGPGSQWSRLSLKKTLTGANFWIDFIYNGTGSEKALWDNIRVERLSVSHPIVHMNTRQVCRRVRLIQ